MVRTPAAVAADMNEGIVVIGDTDDAALVAQDAEVVVVPDEDDDTPKLPKHAKVQEDGSVILPLLFPRTLKTTNVAGGVVKETDYDELHMHRLNGADMRAVQAAGDGKRGVVAIARSARMREGIMGVLFDKMDGADTLAASEVVGFFLHSGRPTGR